MDNNKIVDDATNKLKQALIHFEDDLTKIRTGRANAAILDGLVVEAYQTQMQLKQLATVIAPEAQLLQITPFDSSNIQNISKAIREDQTLGLNPVDDGIVIRISIPPLTTERRQSIVKQLSDISEKCMITMRSIRHDSLKLLDNDKKVKLLSEDDVNRLTKQIDGLMTTYKVKVEQLVASKEKEVMTI
jgi:ribosome recycling factor